MDTDDWIICGYLLAVALFGSALICALAGWFALVPWLMYATVPCAAAMLLFACRRS